MIRVVLTFLAIQVITSVLSASEIIYDNTSSFLGTYATERTEYGDQLDLAGTARVLTEIDFSYYAHIVPDGTQVMKVRLYSNEMTYDFFRNQPSMILYESDFIPIQLGQNGYNSVAITNLQVELPRNTVTFTIEFQGIKSNEVAGLLLYSPPTIGFSFNEFWARRGIGDWAPIRFSLTDLSLKANAAVRLIALPGPVPDQQQTNSDTAISMRGPLTRIRLAQVFTPENSGRLDRVSLRMAWTGAPLRVRILDTSTNPDPITSVIPGTNILGTTVLAQSSNSVQQASFYDQGVYLTA